jgi:GAF domain-containing protein
MAQPGPDLSTTPANEPALLLQLRAYEQELQQRRAELDIISTVQQALANRLDMQGIYELVGEDLRKVFDSQVVNLVTFDHEAGVFTYVYLFEDGQRFYPDPLPIDAWRRRIIETRELVVLNENIDAVMEELTGEVVPDVPGTASPKAAVYVPMVVGESVRGYISLQDLDREHAFSTSDVRLLSTLANSMSVALENARLFDETSGLLAETEQRNAELAVINSMQEGLVADLDMQEMYDLVGDRIRILFDSQVVNLATFDHEAGVFTYVYLFEDGQRFYPDPLPIDAWRRHLIDSRELVVLNENIDAVMEEITGEVVPDVPGTASPKAAVYVPMVVGDSVRGYISLQNLDREHAFDPSDVRLLSTLANSLAIALENARLFDETTRLLAETEQRNAELAVINSMQEGLVADLDMPEMYDLVGDRIRILFDSQVVNLATFDHEAGVFTYVYLFEDGQRFYPDPLPIDAWRRHLIDSRELVVLNENIDAVMEELTGEVVPDVPGTASPKSAVYVPMVVGESVRGYISLQDLDREHAFSTSDVRLLSTLAHSLAIALENARLFDETTRLLEETEQRNAELAVINSVQEGLVAEIDMQGIYDLVGDRIRDLFDSQVVQIATFDFSAGTENFCYLFEDGERLYPGERPYNKVRQRLIDTGQLILINQDAADAWREITGEQLTSIPGTRVAKSMLFVPLVVGDSVRGYVSLQNLDREGVFKDADVRLLSTLANSMSIALENARLFGETTRLLAETEQRNAELAVINSVQEGLVAELDMQGIYDLVGDRIRDIFNAQSVGIHTFDHEAGLRHCRYVWEDGARYYAEPREIDALRRRIIETREIIVINENWERLFKEMTGGPPVVATPGTQFPKSVVFVPMMVGDVVDGYVTLQDVDREHAFSPASVQLLATLTNSMTMALENARLFDETTRLLGETEQRNAELAVINSVQEGLVAEIDMQGIYDLVGDRIRDLFDAQVVIIATFDLEAHTEQFRYLFEDGERFYPEVREYNQVRARVIETRQHILINRDAPQRWLELTGQPLDAVPGTRAARSMLFVPLLVGEAVRGYVSLQNLDREEAFSPSEVRLLSTLANSMSVALENARLFDETNRLLAETEQRNAELAVINSVQEGLVAELDMQGIYDLVGDRIRDLFDAQVVAIVTFDHETGFENFQYVHENGARHHPEPRAFDRIRERLIETRELILINENADEASFQLLGRPREPLPGTRLPKSLLFVPLVVGDTVRGYVSLQNLDREHAFSAGEVRLLSTLSNSMSVALENARLFDETTRLLGETEQRNAELAVINSVQEGLVAEIDMQGIYDLVGERVRVLFDAQAVIIATFDYESGTEHFRYIHEHGERIYPPPRPFNRVRQRLIDTRDVILINENADDAVVSITGEARTPVPGTRLPLSLLYVPLIVGDTVRGYVSLQNLDREHAFSTAEVRLLSTLSNSMSVAIENARLFDETRQQATELETVNTISRALVAQLDFDTLVHLVGEKMRETFEADIVYVAVLDKAAGMITFPYAYGETLTPLPFGEGMTSQIIRTVEPLLINRDVKERARELGIERIGRQATSYLGVPIIVGNEAIGVISVQSTQKESVFEDDDLRLLSTIAANVGIALQNAESYQKLNAALDELTRTQAQLVQQEKLASLGALTAGIAHEIKNPLNFINNFSQLTTELAEELLDAQIREPETLLGEVADVLEDIRLNSTKILEHGVRADSIVKSMLQHSRGGVHRPETTEVNGLVEEYVGLAYHGRRAQQAGFAAEIALELDPAAGMVELVAQDIGRVVLNLVGNAFDAVTDRRAAEGREYVPGVRVTTRGTEGGVEVSVEDNGTGIPDHVREKVFEPFFTTKAAGKGTGLGLSMSHEIVVSGHGGRLAVEDVAGGGTRFVFFLPGSVEVKAH